MAFAGEALWAVNPLFSCLCQVDARFSFTPVWQPPFISALLPEDRCHFNGLAVAGGRPQYVTALGATDTPKGWRADRLGGGVLVHVPTGEVVLRGLPMPHSPWLYEGRLFLVLAASGVLCCADVEAGTYEEVNHVPGFARGLARCEDYLFVGHSRLRRQHVFGNLPLVGRPHHAGVVVVHLPSGRIAGAIRYHASCEEVYDVHVLEGVERPGILGLEEEVHRLALSMPGGGYWAKPEDETLAGVLS